MHKAIKRLIDIIGSISGLIILFPLFLILTIILKSDGGSAFFGHRRIGYKNKKFTCWKFRTMHVGSEKVLEQYLRKNIKAKKEWDKKFKLENDPRITKIGKFLRKTSLDEFPQLWNVLKGDMSLVGPRPIVKEEQKYYKDKIHAYFSVKPGLTGLWQISGRSNIGYDERIKLDLRYIKNNSILKDFLIILKTIKVVLSGHGAK
ncbi:sugar transferase [Pseudomonadota bacterium]